MRKIAFLPLKLNKLTDGKLNVRIDPFAHLMELEVLKYLPSFTYWPLEISAVCVQSNIDQRSQTSHGHKMSSMSQSVTPNTQL